jgi:hypothetical protein
MGSHAHIIQSKEDGDGKEKVESGGEPVTSHQQSVISGPLVIGTGKWRVRGRKEER